MQGYIECNEYKYFQIIHSGKLILIPLAYHAHAMIRILKGFNSLTTEKQTTKFSSANFQKILSPSYIILRIQRLEGKQCKSG